MTGGEGTRRREVRGGRGGMKLECRPVRSSTIRVPEWRISRASQVYLIAMERL
jgi:hypothetical protein